MDVSDDDVGANIQAARYKAGMSQGELAIRVGLDRSSVSRIEHGERSVTAPEVTKFADALGVDVLELLVARPKQAEEVDLSRLLLRSGPADRRDREQLGWFVELIAAASEGNSATPGVHIEQSPMVRTAATRAEHAARQVRKRIGLSPAEPMQSVSLAALELGAFTCAARLDSRSRVAGAMIESTSRVVGILVNNNHPRSRRRYSAAHEIGHLILHRGAAAVACAPATTNRGRRSSIEFEADIFAAALLLPKYAFRSAEISIHGLHDIGQQYGVSQAAVVSRLAGLGLLNRKDAQALRRLSAQNGQEALATPQYRVVGSALAKSISKRKAEVLLEHVAVVSDGEVVE